jgi:hypothetical protein
VARWADEVEADMNPAVVVNGQVPLDLEFLLKVGLELAVNVVYNGTETVLFVDLVALRVRNISLWHLAVCVKIFFKSLQSRYRMYS